MTTVSALASPASMSPTTSSGPARTRNRLPASRRRELDATATAPVRIFKVSTSALSFLLIRLGLTRRPPTGVTGSPAPNAGDPATSA